MHCQTLTDGQAKGALSIRGEDGKYLAFVHVKQKCFCSALLWCNQKGEESQLCKKTTLHTENNLFISNSFFIKHAEKPFLQFLQNFFFSKQIFQKLQKSHICKNPVFFQNYLSLICEICTVFVEDGISGYLLQSPTEEIIKTEQKTVEQLSQKLRWKALSKKNVCT